MAIRILLAAFALGLLPMASANAQYPSHPVKIVAHTPPGAGPDIIARLLAAKLAEYMGQPVIVENRPGSNGNIAGEYVAKSAPDGYTLFVTTDAQFTINPHLYANLGFDWVRDLPPIASLATEAFKLVITASLPARTVAEFIEVARRANPPLFYGSAGNGSQHHLTMEQFKQRTGINLVHVPYKGGGPATTAALLAGEIAATIGGSAVDVQVKAGKLRALGITSTTRSPRYPDLPSISETVPGFEMVSWYGLFAPAGTPQEVTARLHAEVAKFLALPDTREKFSRTGPEPWASTTDEFAAVIHRDYERNGKLVKSVGIRID